MGVSAGELDRRVTLLRYQPNRDATTGQDKPQYIDDATVWASVAPLSGREGFAAAQRVADAESAITIRWRAGVDPTWRIRYDRRVYEVLDAQELGRRDGLRLLVRTRAEAGAAEHED